MSDEIRPHISSAKIKTVGLNQFTLEEVTPKVPEFEERREGENLRVVEIDLLTPALITWQTVDTFNHIENNTMVIFMDFVNDTAYLSCGSKISSDLEVEVKKILASAKKRLTPIVPTEKIERQLQRSKEIFNNGDVNDRSKPDESKS